MIQIQRVQLPSLRCRFAQRMIFAIVSLVFSCCLAAGAGATPNQLLVKVQVALLARWLAPPMPPSARGCFAVLRMSDGIWWRRPNSSALPKRSRSTKPNPVCSTSNQIPLSDSQREFHGKCPRRLRLPPASKRSSRRPQAERSQVQHPVGHEKDRDGNRLGHHHWQH